MSSVISDSLRVEGVTVPWIESSEGGFGVIITGCCCWVGTTIPTLGVKYDDVPNMGAGTGCGIGVVGGGTTDWAIKGTFVTGAAFIRSKVSMSTPF